MNKLLTLLFVFGTALSFSSCEKDARSIPQIYFRNSFGDVFGSKESIVKSGGTYTIGVVCEESSSGVGLKQFTATVKDTGNSILINKEMVDAEKEKYVYEYKGVAGFSGETKLFTFVVVGDNDIKNEISTTVVVQ